MSVVKLVAVSELPSCDVTYQSQSGLFEALTCTNLELRNGNEERPIENLRACLASLICMKAELNEVELCCIDFYERDVFQNLSFGKRKRIYETDIF